jgi:hypothetical protein
MEEKDKDVGLLLSRTFHFWVTVGVLKGTTQAGLNMAMTKRKSDRETVEQRGIGRRLLTVSHNDRSKPQNPPRIHISRS